MIEVKKKGDSDFQFIVKSPSGRVLLESIPFTDNSSLEATLKDLKTESILTKRFERKTNFDGKFLFNLKNDQGVIVGSSGLYNSEPGMENGIKNLKEILAK